MLQENVIEVLHMAKNLRENADYQGNFSQEDAEFLLKEAFEFLQKAESFLMSD
jgi:uncharacterized protein (UPF0332 family)